MTVSELIAELQELPGDLEVIMQKDSEGNHYSPLYCTDDDAIYIASSTWSGEVYSTKWSWQDACYESEEEWEEFKKNNPRYCILAPVN